MSKLFEDVPRQRMTPAADASRKAPVRGALASGSAWALFERDGRFVLAYMSGTVGGVGGSVEVTPEDAVRLRSGDEAAATAILNAHGAH